MRSSQDEPRKSATATTRTAMTPTPATAKLARGDGNGGDCAAQEKPDTGEPARE